MLVTFLAPKNPFANGGGDGVMTRLMVQLAGELGDVEVIYPEPQTSPLGRQRSLLVAWRKSLWNGKSLLHNKFQSTSMQELLSKTRTDVTIAEHFYMAENFPESADSNLGRLLINGHVLESNVWAQTRAHLIPGQEKRIFQDEIRLCKRVSSVAVYNSDEQALLSQSGIGNVRTLNLVLKPETQVAVRETSQRIVFLGDRRWPPNQEALTHFLRNIWPVLIERHPLAQFHVVGLGPVRDIEVRSPSVFFHGFVPDLDGLLSTMRMLVAPIKTGGGVRVKLLTAASRGIPVVASPAAVGDLEWLVGEGLCVDDQAFIDRAAEMLSSVQAATKSSDELWLRNSALWNSDSNFKQVSDWISS